MELMDSTVEKYRGRTVLYVMGSGRSGSTVLDIVLGSHEKVMSLGELCKFDQVWCSEAEYCSCGKFIRDCSFWRQVYDLWSQKCNYRNIKPELYQLQQRFERTRSIVFILLKYVFKTKDLKEYSVKNQLLYESIFEVSGAEVLVDSSKNPIRLLSLTSIKGMSFKAIHLVRDGRGVAASYKKKFDSNLKGGVEKDMHAEPVWRSALSWRFINKLSELVKYYLELNNVLTLCYESFVERTSASLQEISNLLQLNYDTVLQNLNEGHHIRTGHMLAGNRLRMSKVITLKMDSQWKGKISKKELSFFWILAGRTLKKYGYRRSIN